MSFGRSRNMGRRLFEFFMIALTLLLFYPVILMVLVSLKTDAELLLNPIGWNKSFQFSNYRVAYERMNYLSGLKNSAVITLFAALIATLLCAFAAYAINRARSGRPVFKLINLLFFLGLALPEQVAMVPMTLWLQKLGLANSLQGIICVYVGANAAYGAFLFSGFVNSVPITLEEAARIDGAGPGQTFFKIVLPLLKPPMITLFIIMTLRVWNDFLYPLILLQNKEYRTLPLAIFLFKGDFATEWNMMFAATTLSVLPLLLLYFVFQRHIISGMLTGAVKQ